MMADATNDDVNAVGDGDGNVLGEDDDEDQLAGEQQDPEFEARELAIVQEIHLPMQISKQKDCKSKGGQDE